MSEEKKFSLEEIEGLMENNSDDGRGGLNFQTIFAMLVLNWQWFLLSLVILSVAHSFTYAIQSQYTRYRHVYLSRIRLKVRNLMKCWPMWRTWDF